MIPIRDTQPVQRKPTVVPLLVGLCVAVFAYQLVVFTDEGSIRRFVERFALVPEQYEEAGAADWLSPALLWPFVTHMFLHGDGVHIFMNMLTLWIFGDNVEERMGGVRFAAFYLLCGLAAAASQLAVSWGSPYPMVGASGAISGVMGAYLVLCPRSLILLFLPPFLFFTVPAVVYLGYWFVMQLLQGAWMVSVVEEGAGVAWFAHIGGFVAGLALHRLFVRRRPQVRVQFGDRY
jgi:membrane associated rhomboid family serine protease